MNIWFIFVIIVAALFAIDRICKCIETVGAYKSIVKELSKGNKGSDLKSLIETFSGAFNDDNK